ncbi:MAG: glycosyltransferase [Pseudonocardiaceae bacterium]
MNLSVLLNAGPWLPVPPPAYGGIENILAALIPELRARGVHVVLATVGTSTVAADERIVVYDQPQFQHLQRPYNRVMGVAHGHLQEVRRELRKRTDIDLVHDHVEVVGPAVLAAMGSTGPPVLHTLHWDLRKHPQFYGGFDGGGRVLVNGVSAAQLATAPEALRAHSLGHAHLATPLATDAEQRAGPVKGDHFVVLGRITAVKGQHIAARLARLMDLPLVLAGPVGPYQDAEELAAALESDPAAAANPDVRYWQREVAEHVDGTLVRWVGTVGGAARDELVASARAMVFPLLWDEPGGTAVVESLALGTPVIGLRRGCLPELVALGRTGLLASTVDELATLLPRARELDPQACRSEAAQRFTPAVMAEKYLQFYRALLDRLDPPTVARGGPHRRCPTTRAAPAH